MVKTRSGRETKRVEPKRKPNFVADARRATNKLSLAAKRANRELASGVGAVETGVGTVARGAERGLEYGVGAVETGVGTVARGAERGLEYGVGTVERGVGTVARGAENEIEKLTHMFSKQKIGGARRTRTKRRRNKKRARSTKKR